MSDSDTKQQARMILECQNSQGGTIMSPLQTTPIKINSQERLSPESAQRVLDELPSWVVTALKRRSAEIEYPLEAIVEMAIASFLDEEAIGFSDCLIEQRSNGKLNG
jgi:hypothetical protein